MPGGASEHRPQPPQFHFGSGAAEVTHRQLWEHEEIMTLHKYMSFTNYSILWYAYIWDKGWGLRF